MSKPISKNWIAADRLEIENSLYREIEIIVRSSSNTNPLMSLNWILNFYGRGTLFPVYTKIDYRRKTTFIQLNI